MHRIKIFRALISGFVAFTIVGVAGAASVDVMKEFESQIGKLEKSLAKEKNISKRYDLFLKTFSELSALRKNNSRQSEDKEINMSLFMDALAPLPGKKEFQAGKCPQYIQAVRNNAKAYDETQKDAFSDRAVAITELICKK